MITASTRAIETISRLRKKAAYTEYEAEMASQPQQPPPLTLGKSWQLAATILSQSEQALDRQDVTILKADPRCKEVADWLPEPVMKQVRRQYRQLPKESAARSHIDHDTLQVKVAEFLQPRMQEYSLLRRTLRRLGKVNGPRAARRRMGLMYQLESVKREIRTLRRLRMQVFDPCI